MVADAGPANLWRRIMRRDEIALLGFLLLLGVVFAALEPRTVALSTFSDLSKEIAPNLIAALGIGILIIGRSFDISVGSMLALTGVVMIETVNLTSSVPFGVAAALAVGIAVGLFHGALVAYLHLNSLMTTLATLFLIRGLVYVWTGQVTVVPDERMETFELLYHGEIFGVPMPAVLVLATYLIAGWVMHQTKAGRSMYALGGNEEAARARGINVQMMTLGGFVASGFLASVAGLLLSAQTGTGYFNAGLLFEFIVIAAVVIGGVSLTGGRGTIVGAALGVIIIGFTGKGLRLLGVHTTWQLVATGTLMMMALWLYGMKEGLTVRQAVQAGTVSGRGPVRASADASEEREPHQGIRR